MPFTFGFYQNHCAWERNQTTEKFELIFSSIFMGLCFSEIIDTTTAASNNNNNNNLNIKIK